MVRKAGQLISRGPRTWQVRIPDPESGRRKYRNRTVHGGLREAQSYLKRKLQERDIGRLPRAAAIQLNPDHNQKASAPIAVRNHPGIAFTFIPEPRSPSPEYAILDEAAAKVEGMLICFATTFSRKNRPSRPPSMRCRVVSPAAG